MQRLTKKSQSITEHHGCAQVVNEIQIRKAASFTIIPEESAGPNPEARAAVLGPPQTPTSQPTRKLHPPVRYECGKSSIFGADAPREGRAQAIITDSLHGQDFTDTSYLGVEKTKCKVLQSLP